MSFNKIFVVFALFFAVSGLSNIAYCAEEETTHASEEKKGFNATEVIFGHIADSHEWHLFDMNGTPVALPLPVIVYQQGKGMQVFSASKFEEWHKNAEGNLQISNSYNGLHLEKGMKEKLVTDDGSKLYDLSITKNTLSMIFGVVLLLWLMTSAAKKYKANGLGHENTSRSRENRKTTRGLCS